MRSEPCFNPVELLTAIVEECLGGGGHFGFKSREARPRYGKSEPGLGLVRKEPAGHRRGAAGVERIGEERGVFERKEPVAEGAEARIGQGSEQLQAVRRRAAAPARATAPTPIRAIRASTALPASSPSPSSTVS